MIFYKRLALKILLEIFFHLIQKERLFIRLKILRHLEDVIQIRFHVHIPVLQGTIKMAQRNIQ